MLPNIIRTSVFKKKNITRTSTLSGVVASELHMQVQGNKFLPTLMGRLVGRNRKAVEASLTLS